MVVISENEYDRLIENQSKLGKIERRVQLASNTDPSLLSTVKLNEEREEKIRREEEKRKRPLSKEQEKEKKKKKEKETQTGGEEEEDSSFLDRSEQSKAEQSIVEETTGAEDTTREEEEIALSRGGKRSEEKEEEEEEDERYYLGKEIQEEELSEKDKNLNILLEKLKKYFDPKKYNRGSKLLIEIINLDEVSIDPEEQVVKIAQQDIGFGEFLDFIDFCFSRRQIPKSYQYLTTFLKNCKVLPKLVSNPYVKKELERPLGAQASSPILKATKGMLSSWFGSYQDVPEDDYE